MKLRSICPRHTRYDRTCPDCPVYARVYRRKRVRGMRDGQWEGAWRGAELERVRAHLLELLAHGDVTGERVAEVAGVHIGVVYKLRHGRSKAIYPAIGQAILDLRAEDCGRRTALDDPFVDSVGVRRALQALACEGYGSERLGALCGIDHRVLRAHRSGGPKHQRIRRSTRDAVMEMYFKILSQADPSGPSDLARRTARVNGWLPPECWDDDSIGDPRAEPLPPPPDTDDHVEVTRRIRECLMHPEPGRAADLPRPVKAEIARHASRRLGWPYERIAELLGFRSANSVEYLLMGRKDRPGTMGGTPHGRKMGRPVRQSDPD